jgi:Flp pilus assembly protein TadG
VTEKRREKRYPVSDVVAYYWNGSIPKGRPVRDISCNGAYVVTGEHWYIGTLLMLTLQPGSEIAEPGMSVTTACRVVRQGTDGAGVNFMLTTKEERRAMQRFIRSATAKKREQPARNGTLGQAMVEYALMVPLVFLLIVNAINFGGFIYCWITVADAVRAAADYACTDGSTADAPATPSVGAITTVVQAATAGLPGYVAGTNPLVYVCENDNGTDTEFGTTTTCNSSYSPYGTPPGDPEPIANGSSTHYASVAVDVTYTFSPLLGGSTFFTFALPGLPATIHRRMVVRWP